MVIAAYEITDGGSNDVDELYADSFLGTITFVDTDELIVLEASAPGNVSLTAATAMVPLFVTSAHGDVTLTAGSTMHVGYIEAVGNTVTLETRGAITNADDDRPNIVASALDIDAGAGSAPSAVTLDTDVATIRVADVSDLDITEADGVTITGDTDTVTAANLSAGTIAITDAGDLTIAAGGVTSMGGLAINVGDDLTLTGSATGAADVAIAAIGDITGAGGMAADVVSGGELSLTTTRGTMGSASSVLRVIAGTELQVFALDLTDRNGFLAVTGGTAGGRPDGAHLSHTVPSPGPILWNGMLLALSDMQYNSVARAEQAVSELGPFTDGNKVFGANIFMPHVAAFTEAYLDYPSFLLTSGSLGGGSIEGLPSGTEIVNIREMIDAP